MSERYLTLMEAAERLRLHYQTVYSMVKRGAIPATQVGNRWRIPESAVEQLLTPREASA